MWVQALLAPHAGKMVDILSAVNCSNRKETVVMRFQVVRVLSRWTTVIVDAAGES